MSETLRIGVHANNPTLLVSSRTGHVEKKLSALGVNVEWQRIAAGARTVDLIGANHHSDRRNGSTPPITAQAKGVPLVLYRHGRLRAPSAGSMCATTALSGRSRIWPAARSRLASGHGSRPCWRRRSIAPASYGNDIVPLDLTEPEARSALLAGDIDAWVSGGGLQQGAEKLRVLANTQDLVSNPSVFFARRDYARSGGPMSSRPLAAALDEVDHRIAAHPTGGKAEHLVAAAGGPLTAAEWQAHIAKRPWGLTAIGESFLSEQQRAADIFHRLRDCARPIDGATQCCCPIAIERAA